MGSLFGHLKLGVIATAVALSSTSALAQDESNAKKMIASQCSLDPVVDQDGLNLSGVAKCSHFSIPGHDGSSEGDNQGETTEVRISLFSVGADGLGLATQFGEDELYQGNDCTSLSLKVGAIDEIGSSVKTLEFERVSMASGDEGWLAKRYLPNTTFDQVLSYFRSTPTPEKIRIYRQCGWVPEA